MALMGAIAIALGVFFFFTGVVGIIRLPDAFTRLHASGKVATLGLLGLLVGTAILMPAATLKVLVLGLFTLISGPVVSHAIAVAVCEAGLMKK